MIVSRKRSEPSDVSGPLLVRLRESILSYSNGRVGAICETRMVRCRSSAYSRLYVFHGISNKGEPNVRVAVKVYNGTDQLPFARQQYDALKLLWPSFENSPRYKIPKPLEFFPEFPAMVMEEVSGRSVQQSMRMLLWPLVSHDKILSLCCESGKWLRYFHNVTRITPGLIEGREKLSGLQAALTKLRGQVLTDELFVKLSEKLSFIVDQLFEREEERALVHGDFSSDNVLIADSGATAIDIEGRFQNVIYHDVASFLNSIELVALGLPFRRFRYRHCRESFLAGYFSGRDYNDRILWFLRVAGLAAVASEVLGRRAYQVGIESWLGHSFKYLFKDLLMEAPV